MTRRLIRPTIIGRDLSQMAVYLGEDDPEVGLRFLDAAEETIEGLAQGIMSGCPCEFKKPELANLRCWPVKGFRNHLIFFREQGETITLVRVLHGARDLETLLGK